MFYKYHCTLYKMRRTVNPSHFADIKEAGTVLEDFISAHQCTDRDLECSGECSYTVTGSGKLNSFCDTAGISASDTNKLCTPTFRMFINIRLSCYPKLCFMKTPLLNSEGGRQFQHSGIVLSSFNKSIPL